MAQFYLKKKKKVRKSNKNEEEMKQNVIRGNQKMAFLPFLNK